MSNVESQYGRRIALGLEDFLDDFALRHSAATWKQFARNHPDEWQCYFKTLMDDHGTEAYFNLTNVKVWPGISRMVRGVGGPTDWELWQIKQNMPGGPGSPGTRTILRSPTLSSRCDQ